MQMPLEGFLSTENERRAQRDYLTRFLHADDLLVTRLRAT